MVQSRKCLLSRSERKTSLFSPGNQLACESTPGLLVNCVRFLPSASANQTSTLVVVRHRFNTIFRPSGEKRGRLFRELVSEAKIDGGEMIAYEAKRGEDDYLMVIPTSGGEARLITDAKGRSWPHSFSPDGNKVAFAGQRDGVWNIYWISLESKIQKQLTDYTKLNAFVRYPAWAPGQIVYEYAETTGNLWMIEME